MGELKSLEEIKNRQIPTSSDHSREIYESILANEYNIQDLFEENVSNLLCNLHGLIPINFFQYKNYCP